MVQLLPADAVAAVQVATGTFVATTGAGHVIVSQPLPALAVCGVQVATGMFVVTATLQVIVTQPLPDVGDCGVQVAVPTVLENGVHTVSW